jgi:hypothetical protein
MMALAIAKAGTQWLGRFGGAREALAISVTSIGEKPVDPDYLLAPSCSWSTRAAKKSRLFPPP